MLKMKRTQHNLAQRTQHTAHRTQATHTKRRRQHTNVNMTAFLPAAVLLVLPWQVSAMLVGRPRLKSFVHMPVAPKTLEAAPIAEHLHVLFAKPSLRGGGDGTVDATVASTLDGALGDEEELDQVNILMIECFTMCTKENKYLLSLHCRMIMF